MRLYAHGNVISHLYIHRCDFSRSAVLHWCINLQLRSTSHGCPTYYKYYYELLILSRCGNGARFRPLTLPSHRFQFGPETCENRIFGPLQQPILSAHRTRHYPRMMR